MAPFFYDPNLDEEKDEQQKVSISGASGNATNDGKMSAPSTSNGLNTGSGYQNLDKYLTTNRAADFGNQVLGKVDSQVKDASNQMNSAANEFRNQAQSANVLPSQEQVDTAIAKPKEADKTQFQDWMKQSYRGKNNLAEARDVWNKYWSGAQRAQTNSKLLGTEPGRYTLLSQYFGRPSYNKGEQTLDNLLVQQSGLGKETRSLQNRANQLSSSGKNTAEKLQDFAGKRAGEVEQSRNNVRKSIGLDDENIPIRGENAGAIGKQFDRIDHTVNEENTKRSREQEILKGILNQNSTLSNDMLRDLGLRPGDSIYNLDINNYATPNAALNKNQVLSSEDREYIKALSDLSGIEDTYASGLPEARTGDFHFNPEKLKGDIAVEKANYEAELRDFPVTIPAQWTPNGAGKPMPLAELEAMVRRTQDILRRGERLDGGRQFLDQVLPILEKAKQDVSIKHNSDRKIGSERKRT